MLIFQRSRPSAFDHEGSGRLHAESESISVAKDMSVIPVRVRNSEQAPPAPAQVVAEGDLRPPAGAPGGRRPRRPPPGGAARSGKILGFPLQKTPSFRQNGAISTI